MHPILQAVLITVIAAIAVAIIVYVASKINDTASKKDIETTLQSAKSYTDKAIIDHEKVHKEISMQYAQIQSDLNIIKDKLMGK